MANLSCRPRVVLSGAALLVLAVRCAAATREREFFAAPDELTKRVNLKLLVEGNSLAICGSEDIWKNLTAQASVRSIRNIAWSDVLATAKAYLNDMTFNVIQLERELEALKGQIAERQKDEVPSSMAKAQIRELLVESLADPGIFGGLTRARETRCGKPSFRPHPPVGARKKAEQAMAVLGKKYFKGQLRCRKEQFVEVCEEQLAVPEEKQSTNCDELCDSLGNVVQDLSDSTAGGRNAGAGSAELLAQQRAKASQLQFFASERSKCQEALVSIDLFRSQIEGLEEDIKTKWDAVDAAGEALERAEFTLDDLQERLQRQENLTRDTLHSFEGAEREVVEAKEALVQMQAEEGAVSKQAQASMVALDATKALLDAAQQAENAAFMVKNVVSLTVMKMHFFFDEAVRQPLRALGITERLRVEELFASDVHGLASADAVRGALGSLHGFCVGEAIAEFAKIKDTVDLSPLCNIGMEEETTKEIEQTVRLRVQSVVMHLKEVQSWLDPFKGQPKLTQDRLKELQEAGEPEGLREIISIYGNTAFYTRYLKLWKKDGPFLKLLDHAGASVAHLDGAHAEQVKDLAALKHQLQRAVQQRTLATGKVEKAVKAKGLASGRKAEMEKALIDLQAQNEGAQRSLEDLEKATRLAEKLYEEARARLVEQHGHAWSLLALPLDPEEKAEVLTYPSFVELAAP